MYKNSLLFSLLFTFGTLFAGKSVLDPYTYNGSTTLENKSVPRLTLHGASVLREVKVAEFVEAHGALQIKRCDIGSLNTFGGVELFDTRIRQEANLHGGLFAKYSQFLGELTVQGKARLVHTLVEGHFSSRDLEAADSTFSQAVDVDGSCSLKKVHMSHPLRVEGDLTVLDGSQLGSVEVKGNCHIANAKVSQITVFGFGTKEIYLTGTTQVLGDITFSLGEGIVFVEHPSQIKGTVKRGVIKEMGKSEATTK
jgi:hypothetical protein